MAYSAPLQDIMVQNPSDLDFDLSRSLKVQCDGVIGFSIYGQFPIHIHSNRMSISHRLAVTTQNVSYYLLSLGPNHEKIESAPNDLKMTLNATRPKVPHIC